MSKHKADLPDGAYLRYDEAAAVVDKFLKEKNYNGFLHPDEVQYWDVVDLVDDLLGAAAESDEQERQRTLILVDEIAGLKRLRNLALDELKTEKDRARQREAWIQTLESERDYYRDQIDVARQALDATLV